MHTSTASSRKQNNSGLRLSQHPQTTTFPRQSGLNQEELDQHPFQASAIEPLSHVGQPTPITPPSSTCATGVHELSPQFADSNNATCGEKLGLVERAAISGGPDMEEAGDKWLPLLAPPQTESTIGVSQERVEKVSGAPLIEAHSDKNGPPTYNSTTTSTGVGAIQSIVAEREKAGAQDNRGLAALHSGLPVACTDRYPRDPYDSDLEADRVDMLVDFSTPLDKVDDESHPSFDVLSNTTFYPLLAYQPHLYDHGLDIEQDDPITEDIGSGLGADSVMEDATPESRKVDASVAATRTVQPFEWVPPSTSDAFHSIFPGVPFARPQMTGFSEDSVPVFRHHAHSDPYGVDKTISEESRIQQVAPPQDIASPFVLDGAHPSPSVAGGLPEEPQFVYAKHSPTSGLSVFPNQTTSHSSFSSPSPPTLKVDPVLISSPTIEVHKAAVKDLEGEVCSESPVTASVQREVAPPRYV